MNHGLAHFEIVATDARRLRTFYERLFDWEVNDDNPVGYPMIDAGYPFASGGIVAAPSGASVVLYFRSPHVHQDLLRAEVLGARVTAPVTKMFGVELTRFRRPGGNEIGLWSTPGRVPSIEAPDMEGCLVGIELAMQDVTTASSFYEHLFGWSIDERGTVHAGMASLGARFVHEHVPRASIVLRASSLDAVAQRVRQLGGRDVIEGVTTWVDGRRLGRFVDPDENTFCVVEP